MLLFRSWRARKPAERVADEAVDQLLGFLDTDGAIDERLADQLILPLAFASGISELRTSKVTQHLLTNAEVLRTCLSMDVQVTRRRGKFRTGPRSRKIDKMIRNRLERGDMGGTGRGSVAHFRMRPRF